MCTFEIYSSTGLSSTTRIRILVLYARSSIVWKWMQISGKEWLSVSNVRRLTPAGIAVGGSEREVHLFALSPTLAATSSNSASTFSICAPPPPAVVSEREDGRSPSTANATATGTDTDTNGSGSLAERTSAGADADDLLLELLFTHRLHGAEDEEDGEAATGAQVGGAHVVHVLLSGGELPLLLSGSANGSLHLWRPRLAPPKWCERDYCCLWHLFHNLDYFAHEQNSYSDLCSILRIFTYLLYVYFIRVHV